MTRHYDSNEPEPLHMNERAVLREQVQRLLWDVCKSFGKTGECIYIVFKHRIGEVL